MSLIVRLIVIVVCASSATDAQNVVDEVTTETEFRCEVAIEHGINRTVCTRGNCRLPETMFCDGYSNCRNGEDEDPLLCETRECAAGQLKCASGQCIDGQEFCTWSSGISCYDESLRRIEHCTALLCPSGRVSCPNMEHCLDDFQFCNGFNSCVDDNWDESNTVCGDHECPEGTLRCDNGQCIPESFLCSLRARCFDGSLDPKEVCSSMQCPENMLMCPGRDRCIFQWQLCDAFNDCPDRSDEDLELCAARECPQNTFRCDNGQCLHRNVFCIQAASGNVSSYGCADGSVIASEVCENEDYHVGCVAANFICSSGERCIVYDLECDGFSDCSDNSDEHPDSPHVCAFIQEFEIHMHYALRSSLKSAVSTQNQTLSGKSV